MRYRLFIIPCIFIVLFLGQGALMDAAYLKNVPVKVTQPDGLVLSIFASGDEFYNWLHDKDGRTIIQNPDTGYFVYATKQNGVLVPSTEIVDIRGPLHANIPQFLKYDVDQRKTPQQLFPEGSPANTDLISKAPRTGTLNNIVIFIRFNGESEFTDTTATYTSIFNNPAAGANSMYNYFMEVSYNQLEINSTFYPTPSTTVVSYQDSFTRAYYQTYNAATNPIGYQNDTERRDREHILLKNSVDGVSSQIPGSLIVDGDGDGLVDNICFIISGGPDGWSDLLWPHMWSLYSQYAYINGKRVYTFNFQLRNSLLSSGVGVLCHEMFHSLGAPDLYHYSFDGLHPVYTWGLMEYNSNPPRHMGAYMKYRYGTWISSLPEITSSGVYSLNPITSSSNICYKIASPSSANEYFLLEYRKKIGTFEDSLPGEGLLVYRINSTRDGLGNRNGPPDEVYIYRPNGTTTTDGSPTIAHFSSNASRTTINDLTNPSSFLSDGNPGGLDISAIGSAGGTISFTVSYTGATVTISGNVRDGGGQGIQNVAMFGLPGPPPTDSSGFYSAEVSSGWSGTVTPLLTGFSFSPSNRVYANVISDQNSQDYVSTQIPHTVSTPSVPSGPTPIEINTSQSYTTGDSVCSWSHVLEYRFDWGDGSFSAWSLQDSASHTWPNTGDYIIRAQARCSSDNIVLSDWSTGIAVHVKQTFAIEFAGKSFTAGERTTLWNKSIDTSYLENTSPGAATFFTPVNYHETGYYLKQMSVAHEDTSSTGHIRVRLLRRDFSSGNVQVVAEMLGGDPETPGQTKSHVVPNPGGKHINTDNYTYWLEVTFSEGYSALRLYAVRIQYGD